MKGSITSISTKLLLSSLTTLCLVVALIWVMRRKFLIVTVRGRSMLPTLHPGERLLIKRDNGSDLKQGQIVVFSNPGISPVDDSQYFIKRLIGLPGDIVEVDLIEIPDMWRDAGHSYCDSDDKRIWYIVQNNCFVRADGIGSDSIAMGPIPLSAIEGVVVRRLPTVA